MIGTITFHWGTNYGAVIQAYSLQKAIQKNGYDTELIDYQPRRLIVLRFLSDIKSMNFAQIKKEIYLKSFRKKYLVCSKKKYANNRALFRIKDQYTHIVVGSDQVWNNSFTMGAENKITLSYFLNFAGVSTKRISYATSFGSDNVSEEYIRAVKPDLLKFSSISVREFSGIDIVEKIGCKACQVCDPTVLLTDEDYSLLIGNREKRGRYIYSYILHKRQDSAYRLLDRIMCCLVDVPLIKSGSEDLLDWLNYIRNAELVVTNSFHGLMFSIIFNTQFIVIPVEGSGMNGRIITILKLLNLTDRIVDIERLENIEEIISKKIDWEAVNIKMCEIRQNGLSYLNSCLGNKSL